MINIPLSTRPSVEAMAGDWLYNDFQSLPELYAQDLNRKSFFDREILLLDLLKKSRKNNAVKLFRLEVFLYLDNSL